MSGFHGEYEATVDAKGRFLVPGGLKNSYRKGRGASLSAGALKNVSRYIR